MISILLIGSLRSPPLIRLRRTSPCSGGRIKHLEASLRKRLCSKHGLLCHRLRGWQRNWIHRGAPRPANPVTCFPPGKVVAPATKGGMHFLERSEVGLFSSGEARLFGFHRQRRHKKWRPSRAPTSPAQRYYISPEGGALNPSGRRQPVPDRTLGAQGQRPGGAINPRPRKRASTFGNTGSLRIAEGDIRSE